ncbi:MAG TPA: hypothetical protein VMB25_08050 [Bryobacteraceae bacterium]|nr:hypothetical protein [Bryobacteraceae bacterium]
MTFALVVFLAFADLSAVKSEPDLNKRSEMALENAGDALDEARQASAANNDKALGAALTEVDESVELCYQSLEQTHSTPRKSRYYKRAELKLSALLRRLTTLRDDVSYEFQPKVDAVIQKVSGVHDQLLSEIMSKRK